MRYRFVRINHGRHKKVALVLSLSGKIRLQDLPEEVRMSSAIYEITLDGLTPQPTFLRQKRDLDAFRAVYQQAIATILQAHGPLNTVDVFPAVPAPDRRALRSGIAAQGSPEAARVRQRQNTGGFTFKLEA